MNQSNIDPRKTEMTNKARATSMIRDTSGQDLIEYALMAGFLAVALVALFSKTADEVVVFGWPTLLRVVSASLAVVTIGVIVMRRARVGGEGGADLVEYALMAAFVAFASGAIMPGVAHTLAAIAGNLAAGLYEHPGRIQFLCGCVAIAAASAIVRLRKGRMVGRNQKGQCPATDTQTSAGLRGRRNCEPFNVIPAAGDPKADDVLSARRLRVLLADDHSQFRQGIKALISAEPDMEVVGEASHGGDAVDKATALRPDVVLMDIGMPGLSSFEATRQMKKNQPETKVLFLTMYDDEDYLVEGMEVGASGYVLKDSPSQQLVAAVRDICRGGSYLSPRMLSRLVDDLRSRINSANRLPRFAALTSREREVLKMLAEGNSEKEIACDLNLSEKTVEAHKFNLMRKLDIHNKAQLVQYAFQKNIINTPNLTLKDGVGSERSESSDGVHFRRQSRCGDLTEDCSPKDAAQAKLNGEESPDRAADCPRLATENSQTTDPISEALDPVRLDPSIRVLIVDDHPIVRYGLRELLASEHDITVVGEASDGREMLEAVQDDEPDVVLLDLRMPNVDGLSGLQALQQTTKRTRVIVLTDSEDKNDFAQAMKLGCSGIVLKQTPIELISKAIRKVHAGEIWLDSDTTASVVRQFSRTANLTGVGGSGGKGMEHSPLSPREREITALVAQGYKNREMAEKLFIQETSVKNHLHDIFEKLGVSDRLELALYAIHKGLHLNGER